MIASTIHGVVAATKIAARSSSRLATVSASSGNVTFNPAQFQLNSQQPSGGKPTATDLHQLFKEVIHSLL
jgi:hypothetical protein